MSEPTTIGPFRVIRRLGLGGMGEVFLAERSDQLVAVKCIHPSLASDPEFRNRFRREVAVSSRVRSSTCAAYIDSDIAAPTPWLATEYVPGVDLQEYVSTNGPLPEQEAITLAVGLAEALRQIHAAGIVHRDLKPSNVILSPTGPKVIDFGIARAAEQTAFTRTGSSLGSPGWMAPEQIRGQEISQATDMFSWGALVAFASSGSPPFGTGAAESLMYKVLEEDPQLSRVPVSLRNLCWRALSKDPSGRPSPDGALAELLGPTQSLSTEAAVTQRIEATWTQNWVAEAATRSPVVRKKSKAKFVVPTAFCLLLGITVAGIFVATRQAEPPEVTTESVTTTQPTQSAAPITNASSTTTTTTAITYAIPQTTPAPVGGSAPAMPTSLSGYRRNPSGDGSTILRVFKSEQGTSIDESIFGVPMSHCSDGAWTFKWRSLNPEVTFVAFIWGFQWIGGKTTPPAILPTASTSGYLGMAFCQQPVFLWGQNLNGNSANLVDIVIEWQSWSASA